MPFRVWSDIIVPRTEPTPTKCGYGHFRLQFVRIRGRRHLSVRRVNLTLLDHVGQFVCQETLAARGFRAVHALTENYVLSHCVGSRLNLTRRLPGLAVGVQADICEVLAESSLEKGARCGVKRVP